jgi:hypothetical protein
MNYKKNFAFIVLVIQLLSCSKPEKSGVKSSLLVGIGEVNYTPEVGMDMAGNYRGDDYASRGVHDSLYAKAFVAANEQGEKAALLTVDICYIPKESIDTMRAYIAANTTIKPGNVMIMATHTHSGPVAELRAPKAKDYLTRAASAVVKADHDLKPTVLSVGRSMKPGLTQSQIEVY